MALEYDQMCIMWETN